MLKFYGDYHTHTHYSDGKGTLKENIQAAASRGLKEIAVTEHGFRNPVYSETKFDRERSELNGLGIKDISVLLGIEADIIDEQGLLDIDSTYLDKVDLLIAGFHMFAAPNTFFDWRRVYFPSIFHPLFENEKKYIDRNTQALISCIERYPVDILAHPNHRMFGNMRAVAECAAKHGTFFEINIKHLAVFDKIATDILTTDVRLIVDSDSHRPQDIGVLSRAEEIIEKYGLKDRIVNLGDKTPDFRSRRSKE